jgi:2-dehydro-3-deoxygluconokinase
MTMPQSSVEVIAVGECLVAFRPERTGPLFSASTFEAHIAGAEATVCVGLRRLDHNAALIGRVGCDGLGELVLRELRAEDVDVRGVRTDDHACTGIQVRENRGFGSSEFLYYRSDSAGSRLSPEDVYRHEALIAEAKWLHLTGITPALSPTAREAILVAAELAASHGTAISFDINMRSKLWADLDEARKTFRELAGRSDVLFAGEGEAELMVGDGSIESVGSRLLSVVRPGGSVVVKLGKEGAVSFAHDREMCVGHAAEVDRVRDTVGAGDAFVAGYLSARLDLLDECAGLERAHLCAAYAISSYGDTAGLPHREEIGSVRTSSEEVVR